MSAITMVYNMYVLQKLIKIYISFNNLFKLTQITYYGKSFQCTLTFMFNVEKLV